MELGLGEIVFLFEVVLGGVVGDAHPVIEGLEGEMDVFFGFDFDDGEAGLVIDGEDVGDVAVYAGNRGDLTVEGGVFQVGFDGLEVEADLGFEPGFGVAGVEGIEFVGRIGGAEAGHFGEGGGFGNVEAAEFEAFWGDFGFGVEGGCFVGAGGEEFGVEVAAVLRVELLGCAGGGVGEEAEVGSGEPLDS